jgi:23S rRNA (guanosine2251-2'-O)-methyltransferase
MVGRRRRRTRTAGSHQRCWLWGRHAVLEALRAGRWLPEELWYAEDLEAGVRREVQTRAEAVGIELHAVEAERLTQLVGTLEHQGLAGRMPEFRYDPLNIVATSASDARPWLVLDRIHDPHNFGAILRSVDVLGGAGVIVAAASQSEVTPHVARSSAGAVHHVSIVRVDDLATALLSLGRRIIVTSADAQTRLDQVDFRIPSLVVLGNEGAGVSSELQALASVRVSIPQRGKIDSLNVGVAAGVILYEALRQRIAAE